MSSSQKMAVLLTASLSALDGYDILSVSFAAPAISHEWAVGKTALGLVFSAGLGGMMMGSFLLAPLGDRIGRRAIVIVALILTGIGMALCATADGVPLLAAWRIVAGAGLGAMVAVINPLAVEFSNARFRTLAVAIMAIGFPLGGMCGGFACAALLAHFDWRAIFLCGASVSLALLPVTIFWLPESPSFLLTRRDDRSLDRLNTFLKRCGHLPLGMLPAAPLVSAAVPYRRILLGASRNRTLWITTVNFLFMMTVFFFLSWMPQIIVDRGFDASVASTTSGVASSCGVLSSIIVGLAAVRFRLRPMTAALSVTMGLSVMVFSIVPPDRMLLTLVAGLVGSCLFAGTAGVYTLIATSFDAGTRMTGGGFVMGMGRMAGALSPSIAGLLFAMQVRLALIAILLGGCSVVAGLLIVTYRRTDRADNDRTKA